MHSYLRSMTAWLTVCVALVVAASAALAQGVTGSAVTGVVTAEGVGPFDGAEVQLRNTATGATFTAVASDGGRYFLDNLPAGGPYTLTVSAPGFKPTSQGGIQLKLDLVMRIEVSEEITIVQRLDDLDDRSRTGASTTVGARRSRPCRYKVGTSPTSPRPLRR